jgi:hypothetical protein
MKIAYLVMTHQNPQLLRRLVRTLSVGDEDCEFFVHLDKKTPSHRFPSFTAPRLKFTERIPVYWGEFSQMEAILGLLKEAMASPKRYDYLVLITGACYPLRTGGYIKRFFASQPGQQYMDIVTVPGPGKPLSRMNTIRYESSAPIRRFVFRALAKVGLGQRDYRKYLGDLAAYAGDGAWALSREACEYLLQFMVENPTVTEYFRKTFAPDEAFIHTILGNSPFRARMRRNLVYSVWPGPKNGHPAMIGEQDVEFFESRDAVCRDDLQEFVFARKLDDARLHLVDRIDAIIQRKEGLQLPSMDSQLQSC